MYYNITINSFLFFPFLLAHFISSALSSLPYPCKLLHLYTSPLSLTHLTPLNLLFTLIIENNIPERFRRWLLLVRGQHSTTWRVSLTIPASLTLKLSLSLPPSLSSFAYHDFDTHGFIFFIFISCFFMKLFDDMFMMLLLLFPCNFHTLNKIICLHILTQFATI